VSRLALLTLDPLADVVAVVTKPKAGNEQLGNSLLNFTPDPLFDSRPRIFKPSGSFHRCPLSSGVGQRTTVLSVIKTIPKSVISRAMIPGLPLIRPTLAS
jgi:hypothetical protein